MRCGSRKLVVVRLRALQTFVGAEVGRQHAAAGDRMGKVMVPSPEPQLAAKPHWMIQPLGSCW
jgi:hypothetical protein